MRVGFIRQSTAFLPEVDAYVKALEADGIQTVVTSPEFAIDLAREVDLVYRFGGLLRPIKGSRTPEIHEYASASTGRFPRTRNLLKSQLAADPVGRVFLNTFVNRQFHFRHETPFIYRDMGVPEEFFGCARNADAEFDLVYVGAIHGRKGLVTKLLRLEQLGLSLLVAGRSTPHDTETLCRAKRITYVGVVGQDEVPKLFTQAQAGLNYVPDAYPYRHQTSTKVLEYLVAGLPIVSSATPWLDNHCSRHAYTYLNLDDLNSTRALASFINKHRAVTNRDDFLWSSVLANCAFAEFITQMA